MLLKITLLNLCACVFFVSGARAKMPSDPIHDSLFTKLPDGKDLNSIRVSGEPLSLSRGTGAPFTAKTLEAYQALKKKTQVDPAFRVHWVLMDLDAKRIVEQSLHPDTRLFGASTSKIFVAGTLLDKQNGSFKNKAQIQLMADMLVISSNTAWVQLQNQVGDGSDDRGRQAINWFTTRLGYERTRAYQGTLGREHGNELTATETAEYLYDMYQGRFAGAETVWKLMHTCRTGAERGRKYLPKGLFVGGKTGTYDGASIDPESGSSQNADGSDYKVNIANHALVFNVQGVQYGLVILADTGSDETAALLAGGLYYEHFVQKTFARDL